MRTKNKVAKKPAVPKWAYNLLAYTCISGMALFHLSAYLFKFHEISNLFPKYAFSPWQELSVLAGGPLIIAAAFTASFKSKKFSGALLLLGAAFLSFGIAFQSGYFLKTYILRMVILGLPQIIAGICFLKSDRIKK